MTGLRSLEESARALTACPTCSGPLVLADGRPWCPTCAAAAERLTTIGAGVAPPLCAVETWLTRGDGSRYPQGCIRAPQHEGPHSNGLPGAEEHTWGDPTVPDLARRASRLLESHAVAVETAFRCASEGSPAPASIIEALELRGDIETVLEALADSLDGAACGVWLARSALVRVGILDAEAWGRELLALAAEHTGARDTLPPSSEGVAGG